MTRIYLLNYKHKKNIDMNKKIIGTVVIATALFAGYNMYESSAEMKLSDLALANIEALANDTGEYSNERPRYKNKTKIKDKKETKVELGENGIKIEYSRECSDVITYCDHTGKEVDICYVDLNGTETTCGNWEEDKN